MVSMLLAVVLSGVTSESLEQNYADAYKESVKEQKPLMVVVGAPWCRACNVLKESTIRPMADSGELDQVSVAVINQDDDPELAKQLTEGEKMLPQIIVYSQEVDAEKPHSRIFTAALDRLHLRPVRVLHVGDRLRHDVEGARAVGMRALLLDRGGEGGDISTLSDLFLHLPPV